MGEPTVEDISQRIERLERGNKRLRWLVAGVCTLIALLILIQISRPSPFPAVRLPNNIEAVEVNALHFTVGAKKTAVELSLSGLTIYGKDGKIALQLTAQAIHLLDSNEKLRISLSTLRDTPELTFYDQNGKARAWLTLGSDGSPKFSLHDQAGNERATLGHAELESTRTGGVEQRPASSLVLFDKDGKVMWRAP